MGPSHYCEKARWALDLLGRQYLEDRFCPPFHRKALKSIHAKNTVPALMVNNKDTYSSSTEILTWVDKQLPEHRRLFPSDPAQGPVIEDFCKRCDDKLAPEVLVLAHTFATRQQFTELLTAGVSEDRTKYFRWIAPLLQLGFKSKYKLNSSNFSQAVRRIDQFFSSVNDLLHGGKNYLYMDRLTAADISFCSLAAPALLIQEYGVSMFKFSEAPPEVRQNAERWRQEPAGKFVQSNYRECRKLKLG